MILLQMTFTCFEVNEDSMIYHVDILLSWLRYSALRSYVKYWDFDV